MEIEAIYRKYFHEVFLYIYTLSGNESVAEEMAQETFVRAMRNIGKFDGRKDIRAWLFTIARNAYFRYCKRNRIYVDGEILNSMPDPSPPVLEQMVEAETIQCIKDHVDFLPELYREVFRLRIYGGFPFEKIGRVYGKSAGWARVTYYRAKQMLQKKMGGEERKSGKSKL